MIKRFLALPFLVATSLSTTSPALAQDAAAGEKVFKTQCMVCHSLLPGKIGIGPSLHDVVDRSAGTLANYQYSAANKSSGLTWDSATLDRYLLNPKQIVPGTKMVYAGLKNDTQRADLIAYLATLK